MAFWDKVKKGAQKVSEDLKQKNEERSRKTRVLRRFTQRQLLYMAKNFGIKVRPRNPLIMEDKPKLSYDDYVSCLRSELTYDQILNYAKKRRIDVSDIIEEEIQKSLEKVNPVTKREDEELIEVPEPSNEDKIISILNYINDTFDDSLKFVDEEDLEKHLYTILKFGYANDGHRIERQVTCGKYKDKIDLVIKNNDFALALELKIGHNKTAIRNSIGQLHTYVKYYPNTCLIVLDTGKITPSYYEQFKEDLDAFGVSLLVLKGKLRNRRKEKKATIKFS
ncbi:MAG: hypothetical protein CI953_1039 [Methanohalophilus sp.]|nr:MAG: hypothetical protein CI953_1039 [Methanohalophilus sp.]